MSCMAGVHEMFVTTDKVQVHEYDKKTVSYTHLTLPTKRIV